MLTTEKSSEIQKRVISFSPPDITESEIAEVAETLRSGWITTGPRTKLLERRLAAYFETGKTDIDCTSKEMISKYVMNHWMKHTKTGYINTK